MSSYQEYSSQSLLNLDLLPPAQRSELKLDKWRECSVFMRELIKIFMSDYTLLANSLILLSDYISRKTNFEEKLELYSLVCVFISSTCLESYMTVEDYLKSAERSSYTKDEFIETRNDIIRHRNGNTRFLTVIDLIAQRAEPVRDQRIAILCCICNPTFTTIKPDILAEACQFSNFSPTFDVENMSELAKNIVGSIQEFYKTNISKELPRQYSYIFKHFSQFPPVIPSLTPVSTSQYTHRFFPGKYEEIFPLGDEYIGTKIVFNERRTFSVKVLNTDPDYDVAAVLELAVLSTYKHENIIKMAGFVFRDYEVEIQMEAQVPLLELFRRDNSTYKEWQDTYLNRLSDSYKNTRSLPDKRELGEDIIAGVKYLHSVGVLHNNIVPRNIALCYSPEGRRVAKLTNFGKSRTMVLYEQGWPGKSIHVHLLSYRCPELLLSEVNRGSYSFGPDIWATGALLLCLETGIHPFAHTMLLKTTEEEYTENVNIILLTIAMVLGSPPTNVIKNYPYQGIVGNSLEAVKDLRYRKRILAALNYDPRKRVLL